MSATNRPSLGNAPKLKDSRSVEQWMQRVTEMLQIFTGTLGNKDKLDKVVTFRDFVDNNGNLSDLVDNLKNIGSGSNPNSDPNDIGFTGVPPAPKNVVVQTTVNSAYISWDDPGVFFIAYAEVFRSETNDVSTAVRTVITPARLARDTVAPVTTYYYWVRFVSFAGVTGPYNAVNGVEATSQQDPEKYLELLTGQIKAGQLHTSLAEQQSLKTITESNITYIAGVGAFGTAKDYDGNLHREAGFLVDQFWVGSPGADNFSLIIQDNQVVMDGALIANATIGYAAISQAAIDQLTAGSISTIDFSAIYATVWELEIGDYIKSEPYTVGSYGWVIRKDGTAEFNNVTARGNITANDIDANAARIVDTLHLQDNIITIDQLVESAVGPIGGEGTDTLVAQITIDWTKSSPGQPIIFQLKGYATAVTTYPGAPSGLASNAYLAFYRNGTPISLGSPEFTTVSGGTTYKYANYDAVFSDSPGQITAVYTIRMTVSNTVSAPGGTTVTGSGGVKMVVSGGKK